MAQLPFQKRWQRPAVFDQGWGALPKTPETQWRCERTVYRHGAKLLIVRECGGFFTLSGDDIEDGVPDRQQVDSERGKVEVGEKQERDKHEETTNARSNM